MKLRSLFASATMALTAVVGVGQTDPAVAASPPSLVSVTPMRFMDSRSGEQTIDGKDQGGGKVGAGRVYSLTVAGRQGIPSDASAAMLNVTAVGAIALGHLTVFPCGDARPDASSVNYPPRIPSPNAVLAKIGTKGQVCIYTVATTDILVDVNGYVPAGGNPVPVAPLRLIDTRSGGAKVQAGTEYSLHVAGQGGVPNDATAVMLNVTAVGATDRGHLTVYPCGQPRPTASSVNYPPNQASPNAVLAKIGDDGNVCIFTLATTDILVDVNGYVPAGGAPIPVTPSRFMDSRSGQSTVDGRDQGGGRITAGSTYELTVGGRAEVPSDASAVMLNVTAVGANDPGFLTVFPCGSAKPNSSSVNYLANQASPNAVLAKVGVDRKVCVFSLATTDVIVDVNGYVPGTPRTPLSIIACDAKVGTGDTQWEYVTIENTSSETVPLEGYQLHDEGSRHTLELADMATDGIVSMPPGTTVRILSGKGAVKQAPTDYIWIGKDSIWNNTGDTATLVAPDGTSSSLACAL